MDLPDQIIRDAYDVIGDLLPGAGRLALTADQIARMNNVCVQLERAGVGNIPDRLAIPAST